MQDLRDQLLDALLREELGGEHLPNLTDRILARAGGQRRRLTPRALATLAVAAVLLLLVLGWLFLGQSYPEPQASGQYEVVDGGAIRRGSVLRTQDQPANLVLGGYCHVQIKPNTTLRIEGVKRAEAVFLDAGTVHCEVQHTEGAFAVRTPIGTVSVQGTQFLVRVIEEKGANQVLPKQMAVRVLVGTVLVSGAWGTLTLFPGEERLLAQAGPVARKEPDWYYQDGPLVGSLKSDQPLPLYDKDTNHLWNRLFAALYIRTSQLPGRPEYPKDTTLLDEWDRKLRSGQLPPGPVVKRLEGGDVIEFLAWPRTRYYAEPAIFERINKLLDEFHSSNGEKLMADPLKRAFFQRDLWAVFEHLLGQNVARFGDADLAKRRAVVPSHLTNLVGKETYYDDKEVFTRRETMCRKLAVILKRLALPKPALDALPDNYAAALRSGHFAAEHRYDPSLDYLPAGLFTKPDEWVEIDSWPGTTGDQREGQLTLHASNLRGRSYFRVFLRFPGGRREAEKYLDYLRWEGVNWKKSAEQGWLALNPGLRQIPVGTEAALVQFLMALDDQLNPVPTRLVESVCLSTYLNVNGSPDPKTNTGRGLNVYRYVARRQLLFTGLKNGGLEREVDHWPQVRVRLQEGVVGAQDWGRYGLQQSVAQQCLHCHLFGKETAGVYSLFSLTTSGKGLESRAMQGIAIPMGSGNIRTYPRGERAARWKIGQEEYLRLVEYARGAPPAR